MEDFDTILSDGAISADEVSPRVPARPLTPSEELGLQQLVQLRFWYEKQNALQASQLTEHSETTAFSARPSDWALTRGLALHDWQIECVETWFRSEKRGILKVVTGAGKTVLALAIATKLQRETARDLRVAVVVPTVVLLSQWVDEFLEKTTLPPDCIGVIGAGRNDSFSERVRVLVCVLNSAAKKLSAEVTRAGVADSLLLVVDECHRAGAAEMRRVFETSRMFSLGLSATPERDDAAADELDAGDPSTDDKLVPCGDSVLTQELGPVIFELNYAEAIRRGIFPPFRIVHYGLSLNDKERQRYEQVSREIKDLRSRLETGNRRGLALIRWCSSKAAAGIPDAQRLLSLTGKRKRMLYRIEQRAAAVSKILGDLFNTRPDGKAILFHESIDEVMALFTMLQAAGLPVVAEHSQFSDAVRAESLRLFRNGTARVIVSARSLIEGFNVPSADVGIIVAASASVRQRVQTLGRLLRKNLRSDGTDKDATLYVLYAVDTVDELIYEKADWEQFVGANINEYFTWKQVGAADPERRLEPPRVPTLPEVQVNLDALRQGEPYPGDPDEGRLFTMDTQGTVRDEGGNLLKPHPQLLALLSSYHRAAGRFRVTPVHRFVTKLDKGPAGWLSIYLGKLDTSPEIVTFDSKPSDSPQSYIPGDAFPLGKVKGRTFSVLQRDKRLIAEKTREGVRFVIRSDEIKDEAKREMLRTVQQQLAAVYTSGHRINKITVTEDGHVVYVYNNNAYFIGNAPEGHMGFEFDGKNKE